MVMETIKSLGHSILFLFTVSIDPLTLKIRKHMHLNLLHVPFNIIFENDLIMVHVSNSSLVPATLLFHP